MLKKSMLCTQVATNIKFTCYNDAKEVVDELFQIFCSRYQGNLETSKREVILFLIQLN